MQNKPFIFFLAETATGLCWYVDNNGNVQKASIQSGIDVNLKAAPDGWMNIELGFGRNMVYYGLNRSYSTPLKLVKDAYQIVKQFLYTQRGIETPLTLITLKYNPFTATKPQYTLYNKCQLDLTKFKDIINEGMELNGMEGGIVQLLKAYETMNFEIPVDGSIPENIKVNFDGMRVEDTFFYRVSFMQVTGDAGHSDAWFLPIFFSENTGDNYGVVHNDATATAVNATQVTQAIASAGGAGNYIFYQTSKTTIRCKGQLNVRPYNADEEDICSVIIYTSDATRAPVVLSYNNYIKGPQIISFDKTFDLAANEKAFFTLVHTNTRHPMAVTNGAFSFTFSSQAQQTTVWGVTAWDLFRLLVKNICLAASTTDQVFSYQPNSQLLQNNLNLVITSGDAIRASGDANYQQYFHSYQTNSQQPSNKLTIAYGPAIKTNLKDFYTAMSTVLCASLGNQQLDSLGEAIFLEQLGYVFNTEANQFDIGEASKLKIYLAEEYMFNGLKIGYRSQSYDQKAGKYEYNTTAEWVAPIKTLQKPLEIISPYRADPYGIERLRADIADTSTTRNSGDNDVFIINTDPNSFIYDFEQATYAGNGITDPLNAANGNIALLSNRSMQSINYQNLIGSYFGMFNDPSIFVFCYPGYSATIPLKFVFSGNLNGLPYNSVTKLPADTITIKLFVKGVCVLTSVTTANAPATKIGSNTVNTVTTGTATNSGTGVEYDLTGLFSEGDSIYATASMSLNGSISDLTCNLALGSAGSYWTADSGGVINIDTGTAVQMLAMPIVNPTNPEPNPAIQPVVSYGFQYFLFDSLLINASFDISSLFSVAMQTGSLQHVTLRLFVNGVVVESVTVPNTASLQNVQLAYSKDFAIGDIIFVVASTEVLNAGIANATLTFTSKTIKAYALKRVQYDFITGIPALLGNLPNSNTPITTGPGAPYNIEDLTPKRLLMKWAGRIAMGIFNQVGQSLQFLTLTKNQYLETTYQNINYRENADVLVQSFGQPLAYPYYVEFETQVPINFSSLMAEAANAHISFTYGGKQLYGFPIDVKQRPALNESQTWKLLLSPAVNLSDLVDLKIDGLNNLIMAPNSIWCAFTSPIQFVPAGQVLGAKYHTKDRDLFWYSEQISKWVNQTGYFNPLQTNDIVFLQFFTNGLAPVAVNILNDQGVLISSTTLSLVATNSTPYYLWEGYINISGLTAGGYYMTVTAGTGGATASMISEGLNVQSDWPNTILFEYSNSSNKLSAIFENGETFSLRTLGFIDNKMKPKFKAAFYIDQPEDITLLNAFPYEVDELWIGLADGVPDYIAKKINRIMMLDTVMIEGKQYTLNDGAEWELTFLEGSPKKYLKTEIRQAKDIDGIVVTASGAASGSTMLITTDANYFGPNVNNDSETDNSNIINLEVSN